MAHDAVPMQGGSFPPWADAGGAGASGAYGTRKGYPRKNWQIIKKFLAKLFSKSFARRRRGEKRRQPGPCFFHQLFAG
ncbi:hypothetical protein RI056_08005 [Komagataeibacter nataicola]|uniref:hypothetical protein n=1 Tax=Komagataeibacter nataicola TaxID=265960 RepID=UPI0028A98CAC|nr:hypothetical protein [Komagataeibacter nataicola]WNM09801.1 hypothetical protein RI056_08005 [Komagataeibacter nataicola]